MAPFQDLPLDILPPILAQLTDRRDWHACTVVSRSFNRAVTPFLYRTLDSRIISKTLVHHPSSTLIRRPDLAQYVRHVTETGTIHRGVLPQYPNITADTLKALSLCTNLRSMTWVDDSSTTYASLFISFLTVLRTLPLRELTIRTHSDLGEQVWAELITLTGLRKISIWCMEGPPRVLQGWSEPLGNTLTHLELGRCAGVPPTILISVLSQLPLLRDLRLKGAPASTIPTIVTVLPNLRSLDTEYLLSGTSSHRRLNTTPGSSPTSPTTTRPSPRKALQNLTVRTSSMDAFGPQKMWPWIRELVGTIPGLETFRLHAFTINGSETSIPRMFLLDLAKVHGGSLTAFIVPNVMLTLKDVECLGSLFGGLGELVCMVASGDVASIAEAVSYARNLHTLKLQVQWIPSGGASAGKTKFTLEDAANMMLPQSNSDVADKDNDKETPIKESRLRVIGIGSVLYTGKWILDEKDGGTRFVVTAGVAQDKWQT